MASPEKIREKIAEIAGRGRNVTLDEIEWVVNQLAQFHSTGVGRLVTASYFG